jgi:hypothetical protein
VEFDEMAFDSTIYERMNGGDVSRFHSFAREIETNTKATGNNEKEVDSVDWHEILCCSRSRNHLNCILL